LQRKKTRIAMRIRNTPDPTATPTTPPMFVAKRLLRVGGFTTPVNVELGAVVVTIVTEGGGVF
jgi:hypothetical protein